MRYLVTGGAGFIGSHIAERLLKEGNFVRVLDNFSTGKKENLGFIGHSPSTIDRSNFELITGDIRDKTACDKSCVGIDYILHQAALRSVPKSMVDPESYNDVNISGTLNLLQSAVKNKIKRFVFASSSSVYGDTDQFPEREDAFPLLISPYALSKLANEYYCRIFTNAYGLETVGLRYFNVFGPRQALDDEYAVVIPKFIHCILHGEQPPIFGNGRQSRDFTYIDNVVEANILAATKDGIKHDVFNVANGKDNTILELVEILNKIIGKDILPKLLPARVGDVFKTLADISRIKEKLGFMPKKSFEEGLQDTVSYFRSIYSI
ncbi:MAG: SDR family oxidoreductase [Candidatus Omnitrophica bacterium]|nr:SDR family oxidoreductase [Candidatus Omnitrophota bacterium]